MQYHAVGSTAERTVMSYPKNKRERFLIGKHKGIRRALGEMDGFSSKEYFERWAYLRRNTTKLCSCSMCGNPRRKAWKDKLTMQEKKFFESLRN